MSENFRAMAENTHRVGSRTLTVFQGIYSVNEDGSLETFFYDLQGRLIAI
jgi:hypothetical protein